MKKSSKQTKLVLKRDIIRVLTRLEMKPVKGGDCEEHEWPGCYNPIYSA